MTEPFLGYPGAVWATCSAALNYLSDQLPVVDLVTAEQLATATLETVLNGLDAINASTMLGAWQAETVNLQAVQALPFSTDGTSLAILNTRSATFASGAASLQAIIPVPPFANVADSLSTGVAAIPDFGFLEFYMAFNIEAAPAGLSTANFVTQAAAISTAFANVQTAIRILQGSHLTQAYDTAGRIASGTLAAANLIGSLTSGPLATNIDLKYTWNQLAVMPSMTIDSSILRSAPYSLTIQQQITLRNLMLTIAAQLATFLLVLRQPTATQVNVATLGVGQTLMDLAANVLGDFEQWQAIATLNGLQPPYVGPQSAPGIAGYGTQLLMPTGSSAPSAIGTSPSYFANFLGIDWDFGPINGVMAPWSGDFQMIAGYQNFARALGRRLQTTLGTLIYHQNYGSRIPPEVGAIETSQEAGYIASFGKSAILSDPRTAAVLSATAAQTPNFGVAFTGLVLPGGFGSRPVEVNEVISPSL